MKKEYRLVALIMTAVAAIAYLPIVHKFGYLNDDWYLMYDALAGGSGFFHEIYAIDRPGRAFLMIPLFSVFGFDPFYYNISAYLLRLLGGLGFFWTLQMLFDKGLFANFLAALFFVVYPGFLSQPNAIDYQAQIWSLAFGIFSVGLTVRSIRSDKMPARVLFAAISILFGWIYLGLVDYFIGFEIFRLASVLIICWREKEGKIALRLWSAFKFFLPFLAGPGGFLIWRLFFFVSQRKATDVNLQISQLFASPLTGLWWLIYLIQDTLNVLLVGWGFPLYTIAFSLRLRDMLFALGWAAAAAAITTLGLKKISASESSAHADEHNGEVYWLGFATIVAGLLPVIMVNRHVVFPEYSRYVLIASLGAALIIATVIVNLASRPTQLAVVAFLLATAALTHYANGVRAATETEATRNFWWQVAWRAPNIRAGTTLIAFYPDSPLSEDYFIWGPANFIYYPEKQTGAPIQIKLPAAVLTDDAVLQIVSNSGVETPLRRGNYLARDFGNVLVMIQSAPNSCVRVINGAAPELSPADHQRLVLVAPFSRLENVETGGNFKTPPEDVFGKEPPHDWCYFYQKADLARQRGEWDKIPQLLQEAFRRGAYPEDSLEWMPFLQAAARTGDLTFIRSTSKILTADKTMRLQTCKLMTDFSQRESINPEALAVINGNICK